MTLLLALLLATAAAAFVAWPILRSRERAEGIGRDSATMPPDPWPAFGSELFLDAAAGRLPWPDLEDVVRRARDTAQATE